MNFPVYPLTNQVQRLTVLNAEQYPAAPEQAVIRLFKNDVMPDVNADVAYFTQADFAGYNAINLVMGAVAVNDQGLIVSASNLCRWSTAAGVASQTIYGLFITDSSGENLIAAQRFDTPQTVGGLHPQAIAGVWRTSEPLTNYGWIDVES